MAGPARKYLTVITYRRSHNVAILPPMSEIIFLVEEAPEGGYTARALGSPIFTQADTLDELHANVRDAVQCHFDEGKAPPVIRLHFVRDEVIAL